MYILINLSMQQIDLFSYYQQAQLLGSASHW